MSGMSTVTTGGDVEFVWARKRTREDEDENRGWERLGSSSLREKGELDLVERERLGERARATQEIRILGVEGVVVVVGVACPCSGAVHVPPSLLVIPHSRTNKREAMQMFCEKFQPFRPC